MSTGEAEVEQATTENPAADRANGARRDETGGSWLGFLIALFVLGVVLLFVAR